MSPDVRRVVATVLVVLTSVLLAATTLAGYARRALFNSDQFADRATATLSDPSVRTLIGDKVTDRVVLANQADLLAARPIISSAISGVVGGGAFRGLFHRAVLDVHRAVFQRDENTVTLTVADVGTVAAAALQALRPSLAADVDRAGDVVVVKERIGTTTGDLARTARDVRVAAWILAALTLLSAAGAIAVSIDRRRTVAHLGIGAIVVGVVIVVAYTIARAVVVDNVSDPESRAAAGAVWNAFLGDLRTFGWLLAGAGAVVAAAATSLVRPIEIEGALRRAWTVARTEPQATWLKVGRALALIAAGVLVVLEPLVVVQVIATLVGVYLVYVGVEAILRLIYQPQESERPRRAHRVRLVAVPVVAVAIVSAATTLFVAGGGASAPAATVAGVCDGHAALCDKRLDDVVLPATHNSMSAPGPGWFSSEQEVPIGGQLRAGMRGLLFDTHYGDKLADGRVRTFFASEKDIGLVNSQDGLSRESFEAALRLRERLGFRGEGERGLYLCHTFCELGATPLSSGLKDIHDFLVTHPGDIVVVVNQDYVTPADFVKAIGDAGLTRYALTPPPEGEQWPTLREMVDSDHRLVVLAENHAGAAPWYQLAYKHVTEETPYTFPSASLLTTPSDLPASCKPNRGPEGAPLFLINHWVSTDPLPRPSDAAKVNAYKPLLARARECDRVRHHLVNLLAVNFFREGDVFKVVDTLNGVG
jgi:uncharacterized membrane protein HdeD (DUF308 family)